MSPNDVAGDPVTTNDSATSREKKRENRLLLPLIGIAGALIAAWADLARNDHAALVCKLGDAFTIVLPGFPACGLIAFILLIGMGGVLVVVYSPGTRVDAFLRGLAVLTAFNVAVGYGEPKEGLVDLVPGPSASTNPALGVGLAWTAHLSSASTIQEMPIHRATIHIVGFPAGGSAVVTLRDDESGEVLARQKVDSSPFEIAKPPRGYLLEVELEGFRTVRCRLSLEPEAAVYRLRMPDSGMMRTMQMMMGPVEVELERIGDEPGPPRAIAAS